jgi:hypothetical protein
MRIGVKALTIIAKGGRYFTQLRFVGLRDRIKAEMSNDQLKQAKKIIEKNGS